MLGAFDGMMVLLYCRMDSVQSSSIFSRIAKESRKDLT